MQKKLIALAIASLVSAPVFAQSQVTVYGTFDAGVRHQSNVDGLGHANTTMDSSGTYNSNRWGLKGSEDLGNGMKANFNLEGAFQSGTGNINTAATGALFARKEIVGLSGSWGALDLGRNYTTIFYTTGAYDPFHYKYTGIIPIAGLDGARDNNSITYTGTFSGLTIRADHALGEVAGNAGQGATTEAGASYASGPFSVGGAYATERTASNPDLNRKQWTIGGAYKVNPFELMIGYDVNKQDLAGGGTTDTKNTWIGGRYAMSGANAVSLAYYDTKVTTPGVVDGKKKLWIAGFVHNLSKRTELYFDVDQAKVDGSLFAAGLTDDTNTGISVGINHAF